MTRIKTPEETENGVRVLLSKRYGTPCDLYVGQNVGRHGFLDYIYIYIYIIYIYIYPFAPHWEIPMLKVEELLKFIAIQYVLFY